MYSNISASARDSGSAKRGHFPCSVLYIDLQWSGPTIFPRNKPREDSSSWHEYRGQSGWVAGLRDISSTVDMTHNFHQLSKTRGNTHKIDNVCHCLILQSGYNPTGLKLLAQLYWLQLSSASMKLATSMGNSFNFHKFKIFHLDSKEKWRTRWAGLTTTQRSPEHLWNLSFLIKIFCSISL